MRSNGGMELFEQAPEPTGLERLGTLALRISARRVTAYASRFSRKDFTRPQLLACLIIRGAHGLTYRGVCELLRASPGLRGVLGLTKVPHFTTLEGFANAGGMLELSNGLLSELLLAVGGGKKPEVDELASDSSGFSATCASVYFDVKRGKNAPFVKTSVAVICGMLLPAAMVLSFGRSSDTTQARELIERAAGNVTARRLYADAGYDGEGIHELCRERLGIESFIKPVVRTRDGTVRTRYRAMMTTLPESYRRRSHAESFFSALKRTTGPGLRSRSVASLLVETAFKILGYAFRR